MPRTFPFILWALCLAFCTISYASAQADSQRDYYAPMHQADASDIKFVVTSLGQVTGIVSYAKLWGKASELRNCHQRIDHVHPLRFLEYIFTNEEMKAAMRIIQKNRAWGDFLHGENKNDGLANSLAEEASRNNLRPEQIHDFTNNVGVSFDKYYPLFQNGQWETIVVSLIKDIPRKGNFRRNDY